MTTEPAAGPAAGPAAPEAPAEPVPGTTPSSPVAYLGRGRRLVDATAPAERLAMFRILTFGFAVGYLVVRLPVFLALADRDPGGFEPVGGLAWLSSPLPDAAITALIALTLAAGLAAGLGWHYSLAGPAAAIALLAITTYRGSWGQLLHFENLMVLYVLVVAFSPAADVWSLDARRRAHPPQRPPTAYGWPMALAALILVVTYAIAGVAKLRYGGIDWMLGDTLRNHVAYSAGRLELLGGRPSPLAEHVVDRAGLFVPLAVGAVAVELLAPVALLGGRVRTTWVVAAWLMHAGILALMLVAFPVPLFLLAFAPLYRIERLADVGSGLVRSVRGLRRRR